MIVLNETLLCKFFQNFYSQARLTDNTSELGLYVILYAAKLIQLAEDVLNKTGICKLLHEMIKTNEDWSCLMQLRKDITSLMLVLSEKYSSECFIDSLVDSPSVFQSTNDNSSEFGYSSN
jgi:hypothetical protein